MQIIRKKDTAAKVGVSGMTVTRWSTDPRYAELGFPKPVPLGDNSIGFIEEEVDAWIERRAALRDAEKDA